MIATWWLVSAIWLVINCDGYPNLWFPQAGGFYLCFDEVELVEGVLHVYSKWGSVEWIWTQRRSSSISYVKKLRLNAVWKDLKYELKKHYKSCPKDQFDVRRDCRLAV